MGARSLFFIILVALVIGLALIPTAKATDGVEITSLQHSNARLENSIDLEISNGADETVDYNLAISLFSEDLQETMLLESASLTFSIDSFQTYQTTFPFTIPRSGNYIFNLTLYSSGELAISHAEYTYLFYDNTNIPLDSIIHDYYLDVDGTNWKYNDENGQIELTNIYSN